MILNVLIAISFCLQLSNAVLYDYYTDKVASEDLINYYKSKGILETCTINIEPCCASEWRRVNGSCNCFQNPSNGTFFKPQTRVLPSLYYNGSYARKAKSGKDLEWPRIVANVLLAKGKTSDCQLTQAITSYIVYMFLDIGSIHDIENFLFFKTDCCTEEGMNDYMCTPNLVPDDDSLSRLGGVRCLNLTRPLTFQNFGCTNDSVPAPIVRATSAFDASQIYNFQNLGDKVIREFYGGLLILEEENGMLWPQNGPRSLCPLNQPDETRCFKHHPNILMTHTLFVVWFTRFHNYCAKELAIVNPCWDDETLFQNARDIVIAFSMQVFLYEWSATLLGRRYLERAGVLSRRPGFRNIYDPSKCPSTTLEFNYILRYFHTALESNAKLYNPEGTYVGDYPHFNLTTNTGFLVKNNYMKEFTQGQFRQPSGKINDCIVDYDVGDNSFPRLQKATDATASDLHKARLLGVRPYIDYIEYCTGDIITSFEDLKGHVDDCRIQELQKVYDDVWDIDLLAGLWVEKQVPGGLVPNTFACLFNDNIGKAIRADRHFYENEHRPHAFTLKQLLEIRKASLALLLCSVADGVTQVQKNAFLQISPTNPLVDCSEIPRINFKVWADTKCTTSPPCTSENY